MSYTDARTAAWAAAYESLDAARELRQALRRMDLNDAINAGRGDPQSTIDAIVKDRDREALERDIAGLLTEARIYTDLSAVSVEVGIATGDWVNHFHQIKEEREAQRHDDFLNGIPTAPSQNPSD